jgi:hypothetical protein
MTTQHFHHRPRPWMAARQAGARLGRLTTVLAAVIGALLASAVAAAAQPMPIGYGGTPSAPVPAAAVRVITVGGLAAWQITLITLGAALAAAAAAVLLDRKLVGRRAVTA